MHGNFKQVMQNIISMAGLQTKIAVYEKEVEAREQEISQLKREFENEKCVLKEQHQDLDTVLKKVQRKLSDCEMECEKLKKELYAAQQQKANFEVKPQKLRNKIEMFKKRGN